ncbi:hypothetical protein A8C56_03415 [Niabella ginsenosidivorans]|uniref:Formamidopyrimidine-DNA glycosylase catalytic domain-containing protein n=1 Tax=Niabella ginsenosidivorans TaxID=1176587 RepID=A0A1A9I0A4_9BACT|nr:DNA-formamidopyrimidine glycosylase family protein [Niabella ginsenosidivorans]ANH80161.1 hypothetical protein A8C56_03415 [Niabella ginsenosidivorans]
MPELPDLQAFSRNLTRSLKGKIVENITLTVDRRTNVSEKDLKAALSGKKLKQVERIGKQLCWDFGKNARLCMHLMLHGKLVLMKDNEDPPKNRIASLKFDDQTLYLTDFQKAAHLILNPPESGAVDALSAQITGNWLAGQLKGSRAKIKAVLMDQHMIAGIGNAYADEILWEAGIAPQSIAGKIPPAAVNKLAKSIGKVLRDAEKQILKSTPDIIAGEIRDFLKIHNAKKDKSPGGSKILNTTLGGRTTYYTEEQILYK